MRIRRGDWTKRGAAVIDFAEQFNQQYGYVGERTTAVLPNPSAERTAFPVHTETSSRKRRMHDESPAERRAPEDHASCQSGREHSFPTEVVGYLKKLLEDTGGKMGMCVL